jgi:hypothetical protein
VSGGKGASFLLLAVALSSCGSPPARTAPSAAPAQTAAPVSPLAVEEELERSATGRSLWPDFDPLAIPLALYDGENTWLFRHPHPPPEFGPGQGGARIADGRHPALRANTGTEIGGVATATVLLSGRRPARDWAATAAHEAFHVFCRQRHPGWAGDEMELFVYPLEDRDGLTRRREETQALRRALAAAKEGDAAGTACWADLASRLRQGRLALLPKEAVAYERGTELNEGLATYVEGLVRGETGMDLPADDFPAEKLRERAYAVGRAEAILLDHLDPAWKEGLEKGAPPGSLDERLAAAVAGRAGPLPCELSPQERAAAARRAGEDLERLRKERESLRAAFLGRPGWSVVVIAGDEPLWPQGFDPWNVLRLADGEVLHRRWLKLGNGTAEFEVLDREALTQAVGPHPLLQGVRRLTVTGLPEKPEVRERAGWARLEVPGFTARLKSATVDVSGHELRIRLQAAAPAQGAPKSNRSAPAPPL